MKQLVQFLAVIIMATVSLGVCSHELLIKSQGQTLYVPSYTELYRSSGMKISGLATVTFHNVDLDHPVKLHKVTSYDTTGKLVKQYLEKPIVLGPLESKSFTARYTSGSDGTGANFTIRWDAATKVVVPLVESRMLASSGTHGFSLSSGARVVKTFEDAGEH